MTPSSGRPGFFGCALPLRAASKRGNGNEPSVEYTRRRSSFGMTLDLLCEAAVMATGTERFEGFPASGLRFLEELKKHNERDFFNARKERYERELLGPMRAFVAEATA